MLQEWGASRQVWLWPLLNVFNDLQTLYGIRFHLPDLTFLLVYSDEIYANSVFRKAEDFVSLASLLEESEPELKVQAQALCHIVFGLSKDWYALLGCTIAGRPCILTAAQSRTCTLSGQVSASGDVGSCYVGCYDG